jgi:hypothetical protein
MLCYFTYLSVTCCLTHNIHSCSILSAEFVHAAVPDGKAVDAMILSNVKRKASSPLNGTGDEVCAVTVVWPIAINYCTMEICHYLLFSIIVFYSMYCVCYSLHTLPISYQIDSLYFSRNLD